MAGIRFTLDLFVPEATYNAIPSATKIAIRDRIRQLKALAVKLNAGVANEEMTLRAVWHKCYHDEAVPKPCESEIEI
mgnify:CR=1 FL=1